jgi:hypothetical protein
MNGGVDDAVRIAAITGAWQHEGGAFHSNSAISASTRRWSRPRPVDPKIRRLDQSRIGAVSAAIRVAVRDRRHRDADPEHV